MKFGVKQAPVVGMKVVRDVEGGKKPVYGPLIIDID